MTVTSCSLSLSPFPMWPAFPAWRVLRRLRPIGTLQQATRLSQKGMEYRWFPRSLLSGQRVRCPALPLRSRRGYAADLHHDLSGPARAPSRQFPGSGRRLAGGSPSGYAPQSRPDPPGFERVDDEEASQHRFLAYTFPSCSPGTARPAVPNRPDFVAAAPARPQRSPGTGCRQLHPAAATTGRSRSSTSIRKSSASWRTTCSSTPRTVNWRFIWPLLCMLNGLVFRQPFEYWAAGPKSGHISRKLWPDSVQKLGHLPCKFTVLCHTREQAEQVWHPKTHIVTGGAKQGFNFLGFNVRCDGSKLLIKPSPAAVAADQASAGRRGAFPAGKQRQKG